MFRPLGLTAFRGKCCRRDAFRRVTTTSLPRPPAMRVAQLSHDLVWSQVDADRRETEHRLLPYHDVVEPEHVVPPRERAQVDGAVDLEPEAVEIHVEVPLPSLTVEPNHLTPRRRYLCATRETSKVDLVQRIGAALDVAARPEVGAAMRQGPLRIDERRELVGTDQPLLHDRRE